MPIESFTMDPLLEGKTLLAPPSRRDSVTTSRLLVMDDGSTITVLNYLARSKYPDFDPAESVAYWSDRNWHNETLDNVLITPRRSHNRQKINEPYGTPAYFKKYRHLNQERVKAHQKTYRAKRQAAYIAMKEQTATEPEPEVVVEELPHALELMMEAVGEKPDDSK